jgi:hypothetical protein
MRWRTCVAGVLGAAGLFLVPGCDAGSTADPGSGPRILGSTVAPNAHNVISAVVVVEVEGADSVAVRYGTEADPLEHVTPARTPQDGEAVVPVLGLRPDRSYVLRPFAWRAGRSVDGETLAFSTGLLPADLPEFEGGGSDPFPGYVVLAADPFGLVIDNSGRVVWYRRFTPGLGLNFQAQPPGSFVARPLPAGPSDPAPWVELDPLGNVIRVLGCVGPFRARFHDILLLEDGSYWILCDEERIMDLSTLGGLADARVTGTVVQHVDAGGTLLFEWSAFDHFSLSELEPPELTGPEVNWTHGNALDLDQEGHLLVSFRNLSEITSIDAASGAVRWRMGGPANEFEVPGGGGPSFARQHGVREAGPGRLLLLDNLGTPGESRAARYEYDEAARAVRLLASYGSAPPVVAGLGGSVQHLPGARTLVSFGNGGRVEEYDGSGNVVWRLESPGYVFRAQRIRSLYHPGRELPR